MNAIERKRTQLTPNAIADVCQKIVAAIHPVKIIMFGSQADGTATADSDLDLFIIHDLPETSRQVRNQEQVQMNLADHNPFYTEHIFKRGVILYERKPSKTS